MAASHATKVLVIGAGPAGLGASIALARSGAEVTVVEQQEELGSLRRGETIRANERMEQILGAGFFERIALRRICKRRYYSHTGRCLVDRTIRNPNMIFAWPDLIRSIASIAENDGVEIVRGASALHLVYHAGMIAGAVVRVGGEEVLYEARTIVSCGGCDDPFYRGEYPQGRSTDKNVKKRLINGYAGPSDRFEYHFHCDDGGLVVGTIFPRAGSEAEIILMDMADASAGRITFDGFARIHPLFEERMAGTEVTYELESRVPMGSMRFPFSPRPGIVFAGDVLGHVQARGGSGVCSSFLIGHEAGTVCADMIHPGGWKEEDRRRFEHSMRLRPAVRSLWLHNLLFARLRAWIFSGIHTPDDMDRKWPLLSMALR